MIWWLHYAAMHVADIGHHWFKWLLVTCNKHDVNKNGPNFADDISKGIFITDRNINVFLIESPKNVFEDPVDKKSALVQVNGLAPIRCQAIAWTNVDQGLWCHMTSLGNNELKCPCLPCENYHCGCMWVAPVAQPVASMKWSSDPVH